MTAIQILDLIEQAECDYDSAVDWEDYNLANAIARHLHFLELELAFFFNS